MMDFIKYLPFEFRHVDEPCIPKGPSIKNAKNISFNLGDTKLFFKAPRHSPAKRRLTVQHNLKGDIYSCRFNGCISQFEGTWEYCDFFFRKWAFWGPWFSGAQADASLYIAAYRLKAPNQEYSLFNPKYFEGCLSDLLTEKYGREKDEDNQPRFEAPLNWKAHSNMDVFSATFHLDPIEPRTFTAHRKCIAFPVSNTTLVMAFLGRSIHKQGNLEARLSLVDTTEMEKLVDDIIDSFKVELGPKDKADYERVKSDFPDLRLTESFPPLKWPLPEGESVKKESLANDSWGFGG